MNLLNLSLLRRGLVLITIGIMMSVAASAQTASQIANDINIGWNIGNTLEVPQSDGGETGWGNPQVTQQLIDAVDAGGFNTVRIPCAWDSYADQSTYEIDASWLARVKEVVDYCRSNGMYVILNSHWDGGWLEEHPTYDMQDEVNEKQEAYWTQIANYFSDYDEHLIFAGTNEVREDYSEPSTENIEVQESYNQTFVDAVRATGGNNADRVLIVQTYNTNIEHGLNYFSLPNDPASNRLMVEVHYYDPYGFTLDGSSGITTWDQASWGHESYVDDLFNQVRQEWVDQGVPVMIGEYGVIHRTSLSGSTYDQHAASREYYLEYVTGAAVSNGMIPVYWDNGYQGNEGFALFDRNSGSVVDQGALDALMAGAGGSDPGTTYTLSTNTSGSGSISLSPSGSTYDEGTTVTVTANASSGWVFSGWSGDLSGSSNPSSITMNSDQSVTATFTESTTGGGGSGTILREYWTNISGTSISNLTSNSNYPDNPSGSEEITSLEGPVNWTDSYGTRIRGYVHAPSTGSYTFWVAGDDNTDLYLSTDDSPGNASRIAYIDGWTNSREWNKYTSQSATVNLTEGEVYYIEVLHKEGGGGDNVAVAWEGPGIAQSVIDGSFLSPYEGDNNNGTDQYTLSTSTSGSGNISLNPAGGTYDEGTTVTVTANANSGWQFSGWSGDLSGSSNPATITMNSDQSVTANFSEVQSNQYTLSTSTNGSGSISLDPSGGTYDEGTVVTVSASPSSGWSFDNWSGSLSGSTNPASITMNSNQSVTANFSEDQTGGTDCDSPESISIPFVFEGAGDHCWVTTTEIAYINSWGLDELLINGEDFTNQWSNSLPPAQNGQWVIEYSGSAQWSHFEAPEAKNAAITNKQNHSIELYPNPFTESIQLDMDNPGQVQSITILDPLGRQVNTIDASAVERSMEIGQNLEAGMYIIQVKDNHGVQTFTITKNR